MKGSRKDHINLHLLTAGNGKKKKSLKDTNTGSWSQGTNLRRAQVKTRQGIQSRAVTYGPRARL